MRKETDINELFEGLRSGSRAHLGRAITLIESRLPENFAKADLLVKLCLPHSGNSFRLGITGVPGAGKSTFIERFGLALLEKEKRIAVLAVDPSSEVSRGSILGDKTRMEKLSQSNNVFIRPSPSGGHLGGIAKNTKETIILCEAAGYNFIVVETVGVGQSETAVHQLTDFFLLLLLAGSGDELQGIKRGIMEMADTILITKADGNNLEKARVAKSEFARALHFLPPQDSGWIPRTDICSAIDGTGINEFIKILDEFVRHATINGYLEDNRKKQEIFWFENSMRESIIHHFLQHPKIQEEILRLKSEIQDKKISPHEAAKALTHRFSEMMSQW